MNKLKEFFSAIGEDKTLHKLLGLVFICWGLYMIWPPLAFIVFGLALVRGD